LEWPEEQNMASPDVASKGAQGGLFLLAGLCFLLPFVSLSCASEEAAEGMSMEQVDQTRSGVQLVLGGSEREGFFPGNAIDGPQPGAEPEFTIPGEPFAAVALGAALVGLALVFVRATRTRLLAASIAGAAGAGSLLLLALSPTLRALGLSAVTLLYGFWITLGLFGLAATVHLIQLRLARPGMSAGHNGPTPPRLPPAPPPRTG
jgi:hypothetical protein